MPIKAWGNGGNRDPTSIIMVVHLVETYAFALGHKQLEAFGSMYSTRRGF